MVRTPLRGWSLFLILIGVFAAASASARSEDPPRLRVLTYNIHHGQGTDGKFDYARLAEIIVKLRPDLVALQEVDRGTRRASGLDQAQRPSQTSAACR